MQSTAQPSTFGILAEFSTSEELVEAAARVREAGYREMECYSPLPVEGLADAIGFKRTGIPLVVLCGGILGAVVGYGMQYWVSVFAYPVNIGGRPYHSWPSFIPVTFETTVLFAVIAAVLGMLAMNGLPRPHHPLFAIPSFARASQDRFFLCILSRDKQFDSQRTREMLERLGPLEVTDVPW